MWPWLLPESTDETEWRSDVESPSPELDITTGLEFVNTSLDDSGEGVPVLRETWASVEELLTGLSFPETMAAVVDDGKLSELVCDDAPSSLWSGLTTVPSDRSITGIGS